eukprot:CAMPEP_0174696862 /NCGR_PEP_ID=MMETSP1094-20130205/2894_1 /TAXON_ID=156173 /ORGANISM="Chrysochromulina brevifilum, Strain UTEX LB 985" /LENGTH=836 /DNA_ID=CAMNT_0015893729 /DNA_START=39 /DNA_END=2549 /DNA_ORIENTATION=-
MLGPMEIPKPLNAKELKVEPAKVDERDVGTPDEWIKRHPDLVRLTGKHPFNVEPPLPALMEHGFITPAALHYVRNHGAVPKIEWGEHKLSVSGLVDKPTTFTMNDLLAMPSRELPVTLVCAGNRRKEQNLTAQTIGFNWGAAGVSTSVWKGVPLRDVLIRCGIKQPGEGGANHVCFVGVEKMPKGRYGTSINYFTAMDPACDVMLAYEQNGEPLRPDHGFPLRLIIPGYIGGRMIKWLNEITVSSEESDNFFHFNDNRVLPEHVTAEIANAEGWWYKPDYIINELSINSAVAFPGHLEQVKLDKPNKTYAIKGYCYSGGGRKVIRVEVSIDGGKTWTLSKLNHPEEPTEYGRYWCWCFWELEVPLSDLWTCDTAEILVRGWDSAMNRQPENLTWNVMGMMNNCYFRVKVHRTVDEVTGLPALKFVHPTLAGPGNFGGWFEEKALGKAGVAKPPPVAAKSDAKAGGKTFTAEEVAKHSEPADLWFIVNGKVYNGTPFLKDHPGGAASIQIVGGQDCSEEFEALHSSKAWKLLDGFYLGDLADAATGDAGKAPTAPPAAPDGPPITLDRSKFVPLALEKRVELTHDTRLFRFALPSKEHILGLPVGQHMFIKLKNAAGERVMRAYTPLESGTGYVDFVIKVYFANVHPRFPEGGKLTQLLDAMKPGDTVEVKGPLGEYIFNTTLPKNITKDPERLCTFTYTPSSSKTSFRTIGFIAGGSGITPVLQTVHALLADAERKVEVRILYANRSEDDILCREQLDKLEKDPRVKGIWYTVDVVPDGRWAYSTGFINEQMVREHMPEPDRDAVVFMCGPPPMIKFACMPSLEKVGHAAEQLHTF